MGWPLRLVRGLAGAREDVGCYGRWRDKEVAGGGGRGREGVVGGWTRREVAQEDGVGVGGGVLVGIVEGGSAGFVSLGGLAFLGRRDVRVVKEAAF